ncbi:MAG: ATP-grasp domain-containing protein [Chloroflexi bacterium]|nr:ATP-grasp domain-containing protein [Chloroflexota bacterium]
MASSVLVTQAQSRGGLTVVRSLGQKGIRVVAADEKLLALGFFSRYCSRRLVCPDPVRSPDAYARFVLDELAQHDYDVVVPSLDHSLMPLARRKPEVEQLTRFPYLGYELLRYGRDKALTVEVARRCGIRVPATFVVHGPADAERALKDYPLPLIVRPRESCGSHGLHRVERADDLWPTCQTVQSEFGPAIIQEYVPWGGLTYDVDVLMNRDSEARAVFVAKRIRTYPPLAGPTSCGTGVVYPDLVGMALALLKEMRWYGPAEVEFRIDPRDGQPTLMEVNPRLWGSQFTAMVSGVDFPYLLYRLAMDGDIAPVMTYRTDMKARYFFIHDILCLLFHPRKRSIARSWLRDFLDPRTKMFLPSWRDPLLLPGRFLTGAVHGTGPARLKELLGNGISQMRWSAAADSVAKSGSPVSSGK